MTKKTVEEYVELISDVSLHSVGASATGSFVDDEGTVHGKPGVLWFTVSWNAVGIGFGEASFHATKDGLACDDERMGATFIEAILVKLARTTKITGR